MKSNVFIMLMATLMGGAFGVSRISLGQLGIESPSPWLEGKMGIKGNMSSKIVGGETLSIKERVPFMVSLRTSKNEHFCGGVIINDRWILTAAHCLLGATDSQAQYVKIYVGSNSIRSGISYDIKHLICHPTTMENSMQNDIALIKTLEPITFDTMVGPAALPERFLRDGEIVKLYGWGLTSFPGVAANFLQSISLKTISLEDCSRMHENASIFNSFICTFNETGTGLCMGDSGGPLMTNDEVHGLVSLGVACAQGYPDVFISVHYFLSWISNTMSRYTDDAPLDENRKCLPEIHPQK